MNRDKRFRLPLRHFYVDDILLEYRKTLFMEYFLTNRNSLSQNRRRHSCLAFAVLKRDCRERTRRSSTHGSLKYKRLQRQRREDNRHEGEVHGTQARVNGAAVTYTFSCRRDVKTTGVGFRVRHDLPYSIWRSALVASRDEYSERKSRPTLE